MAQFSHGAAKTVKLFFENFDVFLLPETIENIGTVRKQAESVKKETLTALSKEFLPPFEREDIAALARGLVETICASEDILQCVYFCNLTDADSFMHKLSLIALDCAAAMLDCMTALENFTKQTPIYTCTERITSLVKDANEIFAKANRKLFTTSCDAKEILVKSCIYKSAVHSSLVIQKVADITENIILKNS